jgi:hypothetical protein
MFPICLTVSIVSSDPLLPPAEQETGRLTDIRTIIYSEAARTPGKVFTPPVQDKINDRAWDS